MARTLTGGSPPLSKVDSTGNWRTAVASVPVAVRWLVAVHACLLVLYSVVFPTYRAPDETAHVDMVLGARTQQGWPQQRKVSAQVLASFAPAGFVRRSTEPLREEAAIPRGERPSFDELAPVGPTDFDNAASQHPPLYYSGAASALLLVTNLFPPAYDWSFDQTISFLRLLSALFILPLPLLLYASANRLGLGKAQATVVACGLLAVPQLYHIGAAVNNDNLLNLLMAALFYALVRIATGDLSRVTAAAAGVTCGLALLTKGFALVALPWILAAYLVAAPSDWPWAQRVRHAVRRAVLPLALAGVVGGWWWMRNVLLLGTVQPSGIERQALPEEAIPSVATWITRFPILVLHRFWGSFSRYEIAIPLVVALLASGVAAAGIALFLTRRQPDLGVPRMPLVLFLTWPLVSTLALIAYGSYSIFMVDGSIAGAQGRYLFVGLSGILMPVLSGWLTLFSARAISLSVVAFATVMHVVAAGSVLMHFWGSDSGLADSLSAMLAWAPWPPLAVGLVACSLLGSSGALVWELSGGRESRTGLEL